MKSKEDWLTQLVENYRIPKDDLGEQHMLTEEQREIIKNSKK